MPTMMWNQRRMSCTASLPVMVGRARDEATATKWCIKFLLASSERVQLRGMGHWTKRAAAGDIPKWNSRRSGKTEASLHCMWLDVNRLRVALPKFVHHREHRGHRVGPEPGRTRENLQSTLGARQRFSAVRG